MSGAEAKAFVSKVSSETKEIKTLQVILPKPKRWIFWIKALLLRKNVFTDPNMLSWKYTKPYQYSIVFKAIKSTSMIREKIFCRCKSKTFEKINKLIVGSSNGQMFNDPEFSVTY
jgi:outer membrane lipoprotein carrier protein